MSDERRTITLAVVDDDLEMRSLIVDFLSIAGYHVVPFENPAVFLTEFHLDTNAFDGIVSDINMPDMNGVELLRKVRSVDSKIPFIVLSGNQPRFAEAQTISEGAQGFLRKPFRLGDLDDCLKQAIK